MLQPAHCIQLDSCHASFCHSQLTSWHELLCQKSPLLRGVCSEQLATGIMHVLDQQAIAKALTQPVLAGVLHPGRSPNKLPLPGAVICINDLRWHGLTPPCHKATGAAASHQ